jgi:hypothetical protein
MMTVALHAVGGDMSVANDIKMRAGIHRGRQSKGSALLNHVTARMKIDTFDVFVIRDNGARFLYEHLGFEDQTQEILYRSRPEPPKIEPIGTTVGWELKSGRLLVAFVRCVLLSTIFLFAHSREWSRLLLC